MGEITVNVTINGKKQTLPVVEVNRHYIKVQGEGRAYSFRKKDGLLRSLAARGEGGEGDTRTRMAEAEVKRVVEAFGG